MKALKEYLIGQGLQGLTFDKGVDYITAYKHHQGFIQHVGAGGAFSNPAMFPSFTDVIYNGGYLTDDVFVQTRLAGKPIYYFHDQYLTPLNFRPPLIFGRGWPKIRGTEKVLLFWVAEN